MADGYFRPGSGMQAAYTIDYGTYSAYVQKVSLVDSAGAAVSFGGSGASAQQAQGTAADGAAAVGNPVQIAGKDGSGNVQALLTGTDGSAIVQGALANLSTSAANPFVIAARLNTSKPTYTNGQLGELQIGPRGSLQTVIFDENGTSGAAVGTYGADDVSANTQGLTVRAFLYGYDGATVDRLRGDTNGLVTQAFALTGSRWQYAGVTGGITDTSDVALAAAGGASVRNYVTSIQFINTSATASEIVIKDGSTVIWRGYAAASMAAMQSITFPVPLKGTANTAMNVAMITTATATRVSAQGYTGS